MSVTLDTNAYISALNFGGRERRIVGMANSGALVIDMSDQIEKELLRVLREDFAWDGYRIHDLSQGLRGFTRRGP